jgi:hypothetical protein
MTKNRLSDQYLSIHVSLGNQLLFFSLELVDLSNSASYTVLCSKRCHVDLETVEWGAL